MTKDEALAILAAMVEPPRLQEVRMGSAWVTPAHRTLGIELRCLDCAGKPETPRPRRDGEWAGQCPACSRRVWTS
jgi:hypothetical protein